MMYRRNPDARAEGPNHTGEAQHRLFLTLVVAVAVGCSPAGKQSAASASATDTASMPSPAGAPITTNSAIPAMTGRAELKHPVSWYLAPDNRGQLFWSDYEPVSLGTDDADWGWWRSDLRAMCEVASNPDEECKARAKASVVTMYQNLNEIPENGIIAAFIQLRNANGIERKYRMKREMKGYFLVLTKSEPPTDSTAKWQLVGIDLQNRISVFPDANTYGKYEACPKRHRPPFSAAGFETCDEKHSAMSSIRTSGALAPPAAFAALKRFEEALAKIHPVDMPPDPKASLWTTCHLGCCRALL